jgi:glycogen(starch) synthase
MRRLSRVLLTGEAGGAVWRYNLDLAHGFALAGVQTVIAVLGPKPDAAQAAEAASVPGLWLVATGLPLDRSAPDEAALRSTGAALAGLAQRVRADTVHLHAPALAAEVAWSAPVVAVAHGDVGTWWEAVHPGESLPDELAWRAAAVGRGLAEADAAVAPSRSFARALARRYRPGREILVVRNGRTPPPPRPEEMRRAPIVLAAGSLSDAGANMGVLDRAASAIDVPVRVVGPPHGSEDGAVGFAHLHPLGRLDAATLDAHMAAATVFAAPARYAPFGHAVLAAAQAGMALALADIPTFRELWDGAALFFPPDDPARLADVLARLLAAPIGHARRARERAARYDGAAMVAATLALHRTLAGERDELSA